MIYNRTQKDVDDSIKIRNEKIENFLDLTQTEIETLEKGSITINTLNRIENKQIELKLLLNDLGYWDTSIENKSWRYEDIFDETEFNRVVQNTLVLKKAFFTFSDTPRTITTTYEWQNLNALEKILHDLDIMIDEIESRFRECGTFECGE